MSSGLFSGLDGPMAHIGMILSVLALKYKQSFHPALHNQSESTKIGSKNSQSIPTPLLTAVKRSSLTFSAAGSCLVGSFAHQLFYLGKFY